MKINVVALGLCFILLACNSSNKQESNSEAKTSDINRNPELKQSMTLGKEIYKDFCISCHLEKGEGISKTFPPLANSDYLMNNRVKSIKAIKYGMSGDIKVNGETYNMSMAPLGLSDDEVADVMNFITNSWGNVNPSLITEKEVSKIKP